MRDYRHQARTALRVYLDRGRKALEQFEDEDLDGFLKTLGLKAAAFHNFRAADGILASQGINLDDEFKDIWPEIKQVDARLMDALNMATEFTKDELLKSQRVRKSIGKYRSRTYRESGFARTV